MRIARLETFLVAPRWLFLRVETDDGVVGWGEPVLEGRASVVQAAVEEFAPLLIGRDPLLIEDTWQLLTKGGFYRGGPVLSSAVAGIDQALWDIAGHHFDTPVYQLLGGAVRDRIRVYGWVAGDRPADVAAQVVARREQGLTAVKLNASAELTAIDTVAAVEEIVTRAAAVREACGPTVDFALDFHGRFTPAMARRVLPLLEPFLPMFVEEPVLPELAAVQLPAVTSSTTIPIALGERSYSRWDFRSVMDSGLAVVQPDVSHAGGISETRRIASYAEIYGVTIAPHCPLGPIALAASLQVDVAAPNFLIQEQSRGIHYHTDGDLLDYLLDTSVFAITDGYLTRPTGPGLGIHIDEQAVRAAGRRGHDWHAPVWRHHDASLAEW